MKDGPIMDLLDTCSGFPGLLDEVLSSISQALVLTDLEGRVIYANPLVKNVLGFRPEEFEGQSLSLVFTPEDLTNFYPNLLYMLRHDKPFEGEAMLIRSNGDRFFAFMILRPKSSLDRAKKIVVVSIRDIDKSKRLENAFRESHYEDLIKVANGVAHEIRNPLVGVGGFVNRLYRASQDSKNRDKYYDYIIKSLKRIEGLVKKVEFLVSLPKPYYTDENVPELVERAFQPYLEKIEAEKVSLSRRLEALTLLLDKDLIERAVSNLIENALEAVSQGGNILIRSETTEDHYIINVIDDGSGISPEDLPFIFNPFFSTKPDGAGIDLAVVKRIMESHGGRVEASSQKEEGTTISLFFPLERRRTIRTSRLED